MKSVNLNKVKCLICKTKLNTIKTDNGRILLYYCPICGSRFLPIYENNFDNGIQKIFLEQISSNKSGNSLTFIGERKFYD